MTNRALGDFATNLSVDPTTGIATYSKDVIFGANAKIATPGNTSDSVANKGQVDAAGLMLVKGLFSNLKIQTTGTNSNVTITADELVLQNSSNSKYFVARSLNVVAAVSASGVNGLDTGSVAASTWYSVWVISDGTTVSALLSTSASAPTLPGAYVYKQRVGWIKTDGTGNKYPLYFLQVGRRARWRIDSSTNNANASVHTIASGVQGSFATPTFLSVQVRGILVPSTAVSAWVWVSKDSTTSSAASLGTTNAPYTTTGGPSLFSSAQASVINMVTGDLVLETDYLYYIGDAAGAKAVCFGWEDNF